MRRVILSLGLVVGIIAWAIGIYGLVSSPFERVLPMPYHTIAFGASAMLGTLVLFVIVYAHGTRAGDVD